MAHRSNQAVASQDGAAPQQPPTGPKPKRRWLIGWATALAALGVSVAVLASALWLTRFSIAEFIIGAALADRGAEADFQVIHLDFHGVTLAAMRFGAETEPDAAIASVEANWQWRGLAPQLRSVRVIEPRLRLRLDSGGRLSAGALDRLGGAPGRRRMTLPRIALEIVDGQALIDAPFGALTAEFRANGELGRDFNAVARIAETSREGSAYTLERGAGELVIVSRDANIAFRFNADAAVLTWAGARIESAHLRMMGAAPLTLARYDVEAAWRIASVRAPNFSADVFHGAIGAEALAREDALAPAAWIVEGRSSASALTIASYAVARPRMDLRTEGNEARGQGRWTLGAERFAGLAIVSDRPSANGDFQFALTGDDTMSGRAQLSFAQSRLNAEAQRDLVRAFPNLPDAPIGPTFAQAEAALAAAGRRFDLTIPISFDANADGARLMIAAPAESRAATGALARLAPLRADTPGLVLQWPGPRLSGAVAVELSGGGAPHASLLLDSVTWSPDASLEADGTLTIAQWRAGNAEIATEELAVAFSAEPGRRGRIDLDGPARITGPLGDGEVRDLVADLDLAFQWGNGWRVTPAHCLPMRLDGLDAAGLSFSNGAFSLCPLNGQLIAADTREHLSGGFQIEQLSLNGRMAGPGAEPARVSTSGLVGRFSGTQANIVLAMQAQAPALTIELGADRMLAIRGAQLTANARITDSWRIDGAFTEGMLTDPALPGSVHAITGSWSAAPLDGKPIIQVAAGEALLVSNRPATEAERPLFNPLRMIEVDATLRDGAINANGAIVLEGEAQRLARFAASHDVGDGTGAAQVNAEALMFDAALQPYDITERARGMVENVRGPIDARAAITWTRELIAATGSVQLNGVSLATSTIPIVQDVRGTVLFDDLFALTTPPGQTVTIGQLNPGIRVTNGRVQFQLLSEQRVAIEAARFDFASGELAMTPTTISLGADQTEFELTLTDIDAANLVETLNLPDIAATGRMEGSFPLLLTRRSAYIRGGVLRALPGGGTLSYVGAAGDSATGVSRVAFDALRQFHYDELSITLDGDLSGEVVSSIAFSGENAGRPVDLGPIVQLPGVGRVTVRGVPFDFNVRVTAPFRRLAQTAASITDPGALLDRANEEEEADEQQELVDPGAEQPR